MRHIGSCETQKKKKWIKKREMQVKDIKSWICRRKKK